MFLKIQIPRDLEKKILQHVKIQPHALWAKTVIIHYTCIFKNQTYSAFLRWVQSDIFNKMTKFKGSGITAELF